MDDIDEVREAGNNWLISQTKQFLGGLVAAVYYTVKNEPLAQSPSDNVYKQGNRQKFADELDTASKDPEVNASEHAKDSVKVMQGQNYAQEAQGEPMPKSTIPIFIEQINGHAKLDKEAREKGKSHASTNVHKKWDISCHQKHQKAFFEAGYFSGALLHKIAEKKEEWTQEGEVEVIPTWNDGLPSFDFQIRIKEDNDDDNCSSYSTNSSDTINVEETGLNISSNTCDSYSEDDSTEEDLVTEIIVENTVSNISSDTSGFYPEEDSTEEEFIEEITVESTVSTNSESGTLVETTLSTSQCSSSFFASDNKENQPSEPEKIEEKNNDTHDSDYWLDIESKIGSNF